MAHQKQSVSHYKGRYFRTIGKVFQGGKVIFKKFLLGTDRGAAEVANRRLEQLWGEVVQLHRHIVEMEKPMIDVTGAQFTGTVNRITGERQVESKGFLARGPLWTAESLAIAECVRYGKHEILVQMRALYPDSAEYVKRIEGLRQCYKGIAFVPASMADYVAGQEDLIAEVEDAVTEARELASDAARITGAPMPVGSGQTLYQALGAYADWSKEHYVREGITTEHGRAVADGVLRLKDSHPDIPLEQLNYDAVDRMADYWCRRPKGRNTGTPIAVDTVRNHLKYLRGFLRWLHRTDRFDWRDTNDIRDAARRNVDKLKTVHERKEQAAGVETWTLDELVQLYRYASDQVRLYLLLGLNGGLAQSECQSLRRDEIRLDATPPIVDHIRPKTSIRGAFALWPATMKALRWHWQQRRDKLPVAVTTAIGTPLLRKTLANVWSRLLDRVAADHPDFRRLPFKYLRKTSAQLMSDVGEADGETIAIFHCRGQRTADDDEADRYYRRRFPKVFAANLKVGEYLKPMFDAVPRAFEGPQQVDGDKANRNSADTPQVSKLNDATEAVDAPLAKAS